MGKRQYSDNDRALALAALDANGGNVRKTSRQVGVPHKTLDEWAKGRINADCAEIRTEKRKELAEKLDEVAHLIVDAMPGKIEKASLKDSAIALGTSIDKMRLLREQATEITRTLTNEERERLRAELRAKLDEPIQTEGVQ